jgi:hypothetical protein
MSVIDDFDKRPSDLPVLGQTEKKSFSFFEDFFFKRRKKPIF